MAQRFERPHAALADSYRAMVAEFTARGEALIPFPLTYDNTDFGAFLARLEDASRGVGLPEGFVPNSTFWLVDGEQVVAVSNLRHRLTPSLRIEGGNIGYGVRPSARRRGSIATIIGCGGVFHSEEFIAARGEVMQRYWIALQ